MGEQLWRNFMGLCYWSPCPWCSHRSAAEPHSCHTCSTPNSWDACSPCAAIKWDLDNTFIPHWSMLDACTQGGALRLCCTHFYYSGVAGCIVCCHKTVCSCWAETSLLSCSENIMEDYLRLYAWRKKKKKTVVRYRAFHGQIIAQVSKYGLKPKAQWLLGNPSPVHGHSAVPQFPVAKTSRESCAKPGLLFPHQRRDMSAVRQTDGVSWGSRTVCAVSDGLLSALFIEDSGFQLFWFSGSPVISGLKM